MREDMAEEAQHYFEDHKRFNLLSKRTHSFIPNFESTDWDTPQQITVNWKHDDQ